MYTLLTKKSNTRTEHHILTTSETMVNDFKYSFPQEMTQVKMNVFPAMAQNRAAWYKTVCSSWARTKWTCEKWNNAQNRLRLWNSPSNPTNTFPCWSLLVGQSQLYHSRCLHATLAAVTTFLMHIQNKTLVQTMWFFVYHSSALTHLLKQENI